MTVIVALKNKKGRIYVAADRRVTNHDEIINTPVSKICKRDGLIMAGAGDAYLSDQIIYYMHLPNTNCSSDIYMNEVFYQSVVKLLERKKLGDEYGCDILVACSNNLYIVSITKDKGDSVLIEVHKVGCPYALGSGGHVALGSLLTTEHSTFKIEERLKLAIMTASKILASCDDQVDIESEDP